MTTARDVIAENISDSAIMYDEDYTAADRILAALLSADESVRLELAGKLNPPRPESEWHEDMGACLWWQFPVSEPPAVGGPNDCGYPVEVTLSVPNERPQTLREYVGRWPGYHTHFTRIPLPAPPSEDKTQ